MGKRVKPNYIFDRFYDTDDMAIIRERRLKWFGLYPEPQTQLQRTLSKIAMIAESEKERLLEK